MPSIGSISHSTPLVPGRLAPSSPMMASSAVRSRSCRRRSRASDERSYSVTMSVAVDLVATSCRPRRRPFAHERAASTVSSRPDPRVVPAPTATSRAPRARAQTLGARVPWGDDARSGGPSVGHGDRGRRRRCAGRWPTPRSATTASARTPRSTSWRRCSPTRLGKEAAVFVPDRHDGQPDRAALLGRRAPRRGRRTSQHVVAYERGAAAVNAPHPVRPASTTPTASSTAGAVAGARGSRTTGRRQRCVPREHPHGGVRRAVGPGAHSTPSSAWAARPHGRRPPLQRIGGDRHRAADYAARATTS